jgi:catechol 2,3-dioxygenase
MTSPWIAGLRSVALELPDLDAAAAFFTATWNLDAAARTDDAVYLRGTGAAHHVLALHRGARPAVRDITLQARDQAALAKLAAAAREAGGRVLREPAPITEPGGGVALTIADPAGRVFRVVHGDAVAADRGVQRDRPIRLAHVVLNAADVAQAQGFLERALGFKLTDRTRIMAFLRCNSDHHSLAFADADKDALNHIAFLMPDTESVMRGGGRLKDAGYPIEWGPGRHGPGHNTFTYFIGPGGVVVEYTAEVEEVGDDYRVGGPADWTWPPGRVDHWGISAPPSARLKAAQQVIGFTAAP